MKYVQDSCIRQGALRSANITVSFKFRQTDPSCHGNGTSKHKISYN